MSETAQKMQAVFQDIFDDEELVLRPDMTAADIEGWDSVTHINLIVAIEREFRVRFTTAEVGALKNVGQLETLIDKKLSDRG
jgi:acyl carrier protein